VDDTGKQFFQAYRYSAVGSQDAINYKEDIKLMDGSWYNDPLPKFEAGELDWLEQWTGRGRTDQNVRQQKESKSTGTNVGGVFPCNL
jgi:hypothetical protein